MTTVNVRLGAPPSVRCPMKTGAEIPTITRGTQSTRGGITVGMCVGGGGVGGVSNPSVRVIHSYAYPTTRSPDLATHDLMATVMVRAMMMHNTP